MTLGPEITNGTVNLNDTFFVEIRAEDTSAVPSGINGLSLNVDWDETVFSFVEPLVVRDVVTSVFEAAPPLLGGTLNNVSGLITDLQGASAVSSIGLAGPERFALFRLQAIGTDQNSPLNLSFGSGSISFVNQDPLTGQVFETQTITVQSTQEPTVSIGDAAQAETDSGMTGLEFTLTLSETFAVPVSVVVSTQDGSALVSDSDYIPLASFPVTIPADTLTATFQVQINGDNKVELDEQFLVNIVGTDGPSIGDGQAVGTIQNDDTASLSITNVSLNEGTIGTTTPFVFMVALDNPVQGGFDLAFTTNDGSGANPATTADSDYQDNDASLSFAGTAGETQPITVLVNHDATVEADETFEVLLGALSNIDPVLAANITVPTTPGIGTIVNDDMAPLTVSVDDVSQNEDDGPMSFTLTLSEISPTAVIVTVSTADGSGANAATQADNDYVPLTNFSVTIPADTLTATFQVQVNSDNKVELDEQFLVNIVGTDGPLIGDGQGVGTILNDDTATLSITNVTLDEGTGGTTTPFVFMVTLDNPVEGGFDLAFTTNDGAGADPATTANNDYQDNDGSLSFAGTANESLPITVLVNHDATVEANETFEVMLGSLSNIDPVLAANITVPATPGIGTITNDDFPPLTVSIDDVSQNEDAGPMTFTLTLSETSPTAVIVTVSTADGAGANAAMVADNDYDPLTAFPVTIPADTLTATFQVQVNADSKVELDEQFLVNIVGTDGPDIGDGQGVGTILNDDTAALSITNVTLDEGTGGTTTPFVFMVTLDNPVQGGFDLAFTTNDGTGANPATTADNDYQANSAILSFAGTGGESRPITVLVNHDATVEPDETFEVMLGQLSNINPVLADNITVPAMPGIGTILNDDEIPITVSIDDVAQDEDAGPMTFTLTLSETSNTPFSVTVSTADGSATEADNDYVPLMNFPVPIPANTLTASFEVQLVTDSKVELDEDFFVNIVGTDGPSIGDGQGRGMIVNDDQATISIDDPVLVEGDSGESSIVFTVTLSEQVDEDVLVSFATADNTATVADGDYDSMSGSVTFPAASVAGQQTQTISVPINGDAKVELDETFFVNLSDIQSGGRNVVFDKSQGLATISNDDQAAISIDDPTLVEGNSGQANMVFTVTLSEQVDSTVTVDFAPADGTATLADGDYSSTSGMVSFSPATSPGPQTQTISVPVNGDLTVELDEAFFVNLSNIQAAGRNVNFADEGSGPDNQGIGTIENDDQALISIADISQLEGTDGTTAFVLTVSMTNPADRDVTVSASTSDGSAFDDNPAFEDDDYSALNGMQIVIGQGQTTATLTVSVTADSKFENDEDFTVTLSDPLFGGSPDLSRADIDSSDANADGDDHIATATVENDDPLPTISIVNDVTMNEPRVGTVEFVFNVVLSNPSFQQVTVDFTTIDGTAISAEGDFQSTSGMLTFNGDLSGPDDPGPANETMKQITVVVNADDLQEPIEQFQVVLSNPTNGMIAPGGEARTGTIVDDSMDAELRGFVFVDTDRDGQRDAGVELGVPGVMIVLTGTTNQGDAVEISAMTGDDGSYAFVDLSAGTYEIQEIQPNGLIDGMDSIGTQNGDVDNDRLFNIMLEPSQVGTDNNFGEQGLIPQLITKSMFFTNRPSRSAMLRELVAVGEEMAGDAEKAAVIRGGDTESNPSVRSAKVLFFDGFDLPQLDTTKFNVPAGNDATQGRTEFREASAIPAVQNGVIRLPVDTFNSSSPGGTVLGTEIVTDQEFEVGMGLAVEARARIVNQQGNPVPAGLVGGIALSNNDNAARDEIDVQLLTGDVVNDNERIFTNVFENADVSGGAAGDSAFAELVGLDLTQFNTYRIEWLPDQVRWLINGQVVRTETDTVPDSPMRVELNFWAPDSTFAEAFDAALQPEGSAADNDEYFFEVDFLRVTRAVDAMFASGVL